MYGRASAGAPPYAVGVCHFAQQADEVAAFLFSPDNMGRWNDELCEKGSVRHKRGVWVLSYVLVTHAGDAACRAARPVLEQVLKMLNDNAALGHLIYYAEEALGFTIVASRVRPACRGAAWERSMCADATRPDPSSSTEPGHPVDSPEAGGRHHPHRLQLRGR